MAAVALLSRTCSSAVDAKGFQSERNAWSLGRNVNVIAGLVQKRKRLPIVQIGRNFKRKHVDHCRNAHGASAGASAKTKNSRNVTPSCRLLLQDEICDCFENDIHAPSSAAHVPGNHGGNTVYAKSTTIVELNSSERRPLRQSVQYMIRGCYFSYDSYHGRSPHQLLESVGTGTGPDAHTDDSAGVLRFNQGEADLMSLRTLKQRAKNIVPKIPTMRKRKTPTLQLEKSTDHQQQKPQELVTEPSSAILSGIIQPLIPTNIWSSLTGKEFFFPSTLTDLIQTGIRTALPQSKEIIDWSPADSKTKKILELNDDQAIRDALEDDDVLVWIGKFKKEGYGSDLPVIKTMSILPLSPRDMASLLMDSSKVQSYNKMSLGRNDEVVFQQGIDTDATESAKTCPLSIDGEAKIVRNLTKPPLSKKLMEFVTVMYARRLKSEDNVGIGIMGGNHSDGYAVISRAVSGGKWGTGGNDDGERIRSEILLGMNLIRSVPGETNKAEVTAVTHCNSPSVPKMLAKTVGVKGAVDFVKDIREMFS